jgi:phage portal protein BeeE
MSDEKAVINPFKDLGKKMKQDFEKFQEGFNKMIGISKDKPIEDANNTTSTQESSEELSEPEISQGVNNFVESSKKSFSDIQNQWNQTFQSFVGKGKDKDEKNQEKMQTVNKNMLGFFTNQQQQMNSFFKNLDTQMKEKSKQNREKFFQMMNNSADTWGEFVAKQQQQFEKGLSDLNKMGWKAQLRFILYAIPILIVIALLFSMISPLIV